MQRTWTTIGVVLATLCFVVPALAEDARRLPSREHIEIRARDLRLTETAAQRLEHIAARFFRATHRRLVVTGGTRTSERQAELMVEKLTRGEELLGLYQNARAATELRTVYREGTAKGLKHRALVCALRDRIDEQMARGVYVSRHLLAGAADVRSRDMTPVQEAAFRAAVAEERGVVLVDERESPEPNFHLALVR